MFKTRCISQFMAVRLQRLYITEPIALRVMKNRKNIRIVHSGHVEAIILMTRRGSEEKK